MQTSEIEWKTSQSGASRPRRISASGTNGLARVQAEWFVGSNVVPHAPHRVTIFRTKSDVRTAERGVSTAVLRDAEPLLTRITSELGEQLASLGVADPTKDLIERAKALPPSPRGNPSFYSDLLSLFTAMTDAGVTDPVKTLCRVTKRPEGTVKTQLRIARRGGLIRPSEVDSATNGPE